MRNREEKKEGQKAEGIRSRGREREREREEEREETGARVKEPGRDDERSNARGTGLRVAHCNDSRTQSGKRRLLQGWEITGLFIRGCLQCQRFREDSPGAISGSNMKNWRGQESGKSLVYRLMWRRTWFTRWRLDRTGKGETRKEGGETWYAAICKKKKGKEGVGLEKMIE